MKVLVCGGRDFDDFKTGYSVLDRVARDYGIIDIVIQGGARGADRVGELWAQSRKIHAAEIRAQWDNWGKSAGHIRNRVMCDLLTPNDLVVAFPGNDGTKHMIRTARDNKIPVMIVTEDGVVLDD